MTHALNDQGLLVLAGNRLDYRMIGPRPADAPTIVMLHEGLGSVAQWGDLPDRLAQATGAGVFVYSRQGYGRSSPVSLPRPLDYMEREARDVLPNVLEAIGLTRGILLGHSDGASIAALYAGNVQDHRIRALSLIAPHFFVEDVSIASIAEARRAYETGDLKPRLAKYHADVDGAFRGWNDAWLDPGFRSWDIVDALGYIRVPVQIVQGANDPYGTLDQIRVAEEECYCPVDVTILPDIGHAPHREAPEVALNAIAGFCNRVLTIHDERRPRVAA